VAARKRCDLDNILFTSAVHQFADALRHSMQEVARCGCAGRVSSRGFTVRQRSYLLIAMLLLSVAWVGGAQAQSAGEVPSVYPQVGAPGARFSFVVSGFSARERVGVWINLPDGRVIDRGIENLDRATRQGRVSWNWTAPEGSAPGTYQMVARGVSSGIEKQISFEIRAVAPSAEGSNIEPKAAVAGSLFTFYASGFLLNEDVYLWANAPDGTQLDVKLARRTLYNGRLDAAWSAPVAAQPGAWQIVVRGIDSGIERVLRFEIR
jgi:hypothetical protein